MAAQIQDNEVVSSALTTAQPQSLLEFEILGFRLWMIVGLIMVAFGVVIIVLCCLFDCCIPRTKQEIELDYEKKLLAKRMTNQLDRIPPGFNLKIVRGFPTSGATRSKTVLPIPSISLQTLQNNDLHNSENISCNPSTSLQGNMEMPSETTMEPIHSPAL